MRHTGRVQVVIDLANPSAIPEEEALRLTSLGDAYNSPPEDFCPPGDAPVDADRPARASRSTESNPPTNGGAAVDAVGANTQTVPVATHELPLRQLHDFFLHDENGQACRLEVWPAVA